VGAEAVLADRIERMGDLAEHIANMTRRVHPSQVVPDELRDTFASLGEITASIHRGRSGGDAG
jgi:phosphate transport system protein